MSFTARGRGKSRNFFSYFESASSGASKSSTAQQILDNKKKEDFNKLKSLSMFTSTDSLAAKVYMLSFSRGNIFDSFSTPNKEDFFELRFMRKKDEQVTELRGSRENLNPFRIGLTQHTTSAFTQVYCKDLKDVFFFDNEKKMHFVIQHKQPRKEFVIKFHFYHDYEVLKKKLESILILEGRGKYEKVHSHHRFKGVGTNKAIQKTYSLSNRLSSSGIYHKVEFSKWKKKQHKKWLQRAFIFDPNEKNPKSYVKSSNQFLTQYFPKVQKELLNFLEKDENNLSTLLESLLEEPDTDLAKVLSLSDPPKEADNLKYFSKILIQHIRTLIHLDVGESKFFSKPYYRVFEKVLKHSTVENLDHFSQVFRKVRFDDITLWDYEELRDWILVLILFNTPLQIRRRTDMGPAYQHKKDLITHFEESFENFCFEQMEFSKGDGSDEEEGEEDEGEVVDDEDEEEGKKEYSVEDLLETPGEAKSPWEEGTRESKIPPDRFDEFLAEYNRINGFRIQDISFPFRYKMRRNEKRKEMMKFAKEIQKFKKENRKLKGQNKELQKKLMGLHEENEQLMNDLMTKIDDEEFMLTAPIRMEELETEISGLEEERAEVKKKIEENEKQAKKIDKKTLEQCRFELQLLQCPQYSEGEWAFLRSQARRDEIGKLVNRRLEFLRKEYGVMELVVKVVLSQFKEAKAKGYQKRLMKVINPILSPKFFTFGFIHSSVLLKNCGFHWLSNELITVKDLDLSDGYEDIFCVDAHCPILFNNIKQLIDLVEGLALTIVNWNARTKYSSWGGPSSIIPSSKSSSMNCQEATIKIVEKLEFTKFFKEVWSFVDGMKERVDEGNKTLRFFNVKWVNLDDGSSGETKFMKEFEEVLNGKKVIDFPTHRDLDEFVIKLRRIDKNLQLNYPGVWQLLKAFDRSFWMIQMKNNESEETKESRLRCPFKAKGIELPSEDEII